jgi:hypothetical protein
MKLPHITILFPLVTIELPHSTMKFPLVAVAFPWFYTIVTSFVIQIPTLWERNLITQSRLQTKKPTRLGIGFFYILNLERKVIKHLGSYLW